MTSHLELFVWSCESVTDLPKHTRIMGLGVEGSVAHGIGHVG